MSYSPESEDNSLNLGKRIHPEGSDLETVKKEGKIPFYKGNVIPGQFNYEPTTSPDEVLMKKEQGEKRAEIDQLAERAESLGPDDLLRPILMKRISILHEDLGNSRNDAIRQEMNRLRIKTEDLEEEVRNLGMNDARRIKQNEKITTINQIIESYKNDLADSEKMAA